MGFFSAAVWSLTVFSCCGSVKMSLTLTRSDRRILPANCFGGAKRRGPTKTVIHNKSGKKSTFLLSFFLESKGLSSSCCYWGLMKLNYYLFLLLNEFERIKTWCFWEEASLVCCWHWRLWAAADLPIHLEFLSHLFYGDAVAYESLIDVMAKVRRVIALMVSPEVNQNSSERFCSIWYQRSGSTPGILLSAIMLTAITKINVCLLLLFFFLFLNRMFCHKNGK